MTANDHDDEPMSDKLAGLSLWDAYLYIAGEEVDQRLMDEAAMLLHECAPEVLRGLELALQGKDDSTLTFIWGLAIGYALRGEQSS